MNPISALAIYFILWWLVLFLVLPFGARSQHDAGEAIMGTDHGAPVRPQLGKKLIITSLVAGLVFACVYAAFVVFGFELEDLII